MANVWQKAFNRIFWRNKDKGAPYTPLGESKLLPMDASIDEMDDRILTLNTTKADQSDLLTAFKSVSFNSTTGVFTFTKFNDTTVTVDTDIEKIAINFDYDDDPTSAHYQNLIITLEDGTIKYVDMSALLTQYEFTDSTTIHFTVTNGVVSANVINGSIAYAHLTPELQAQVNGAQGYSEESEAWAVGQKNGQDVPSTDPRYHNNSKYYAQQAEASLSNTVRSFNGRTGAVSPASGDYDITDMGDVNITSPTEGQGLRYNAQSGKWENGDAASAVSNLTDVDLTNLANNQILKYNSTAQKWENADEKGHTIQNASGTAQTQRANMQFPDSFVSDDDVNGRTVVENIKEVAPADYASTTDEGIIVCDDGNDVPIGEIEEDVISVTADGVKTFAQLLNDVFNDSKFDITKVTKDSILKIGESIYFPTIISTTYNYARFIREVCNSTSLYLEDITISSSSTAYATTVNGSTYNRENDSSTVEPNGMVITLYYGTSSTVINLKTSADYCMMSDGVTSVESAINGLNTSTLIGNLGHPTTETNKNLTDSISNYKYLFFSIEQYSGDVPVNSHGTLLVPCDLFKVGTKFIITAGSTSQGGATVKYISDTVIAVKRDYDWFDVAVYGIG